MVPKLDHTPTSKMVEQCCARHNARKKRLGGGHHHTTRDTNHRRQSTQYNNTQTKSIPRNTTQNKIAHSNMKIWNRNRIEHTDQSAKNANTNSADQSAKNSLRKHTNQTNTTHSTDQFVKKCNHPITRSILEKNNHAPNSDDQSATKITICENNNHMHFVGE